MSCRYPECLNPKTHRFGLCNRHRKWVEQGLIDVELNVLGKLPTKNYYKFTTCKVSDCGKRAKKKYFCISHYQQFNRGSIDKDGNRLIRPFRYPKDQACLRCGDVTGRIVLGFCLLDYDRFKNGIIDATGKQIREPKRVKAYSTDEICKVKGCDKKPRARGFCKGHYTGKVKGSYDEDGRRLKDYLIKNRGKKCLLCENEAVCKKFCKQHYNSFRYAKKGFKNKGNKCVLESCSNEAAVKYLCRKHYQLEKRKNKKLIKEVLQKNG